MLLEQRKWCDWGVGWEGGLIGLLQKKRNFLDFQSISHQVAVDKSSGPGNVFRTGVILKIALCGAQLAPLSLRMGL